MTLFRTLAILHVGAGMTALLTALIATLSRSLNFSHGAHVLSGRIFFWCMAVVCATAVPMTILHPNTFLFLIALFSFYLALTGRRYARNRKGIPTRFDRGIAGGMALLSGGMICFGLFLLISGDSGGITMMVFGGIGGWLGLLDLKRLHAGGLKGKQRIAAHLTAMLAAGIASLTAFTVTNVKLTPGFLLWLAPTLIITPVIIVWNRKILSGREVPYSSGGKLTDNRQQ